MNEAFTAKSYQINRAPRRIKLLGNKCERPEPAQHIIEFPGGAIEVSRTSGGHYWAHIIINRKEGLDDCEGLHAVRGVVIGSRIGSEDGVKSLDCDESTEQIAVLIGRAP